MDDGERTQNQAPAGDTPQGQVTARFKLTFCTLVALTLLALAVDVLLAVFGGDSDQVRTAVDTCSTTYKMGFGAIVGLMSQRHA